MTRKNLRKASVTMIDEMKNAKYKYKLAIRNAAGDFKNRFNNDMLECLMDKDMTFFWKVWGSETRDKKAFIPNVDRFSNNIDIAKIFIDKFKFNAGLPEKSVNYGLSDSNLESNLLFIVGEKDSAVWSKLKLGKFAGLDGVQPEHIVCVYPAVILHLCNLITFVIPQRYVPARFGEGVIVLLVKDKCDVLNSDNYRGITTCIISKIFELCMMSKIEKHLVTNKQNMVLRKVLVVVMLCILCTKQLNVFVTEAVMCMRQLWMPARHSTELITTNYSLC